MNDFSTTYNSGGLLKKDYDPQSDQMEALRRRRLKMGERVKAQTQDPQQDGGNDE